MECSSDPQIWIAFLTLAALADRPRIDNIVSSPILVGKLPVPSKRRRTVSGSACHDHADSAVVSLSWIMGLTRPLFTVPFVGLAVSGRDLVLIVGGLFLVAKSTHEIHSSLEGVEGEHSAGVASSYLAVLAADHGARHRLLARLRDHGGGDGPAGGRDDRRRSSRPCW